MYMSDPLIDARTFQHQLARLANTIALKVEREAAKTMLPAFAAADVTMLLRQSLSIYELMCFVNADHIRKIPGWKPAYTAALLSLIRSMIDCLYNVTMLLTDSSRRYHFRESGYKLFLEALHEDEARYGGNPKWDDYIAHHRSAIDVAMRGDGITLDEIKAAKKWPTLSGYLAANKGTPLPPHQEFLEKLTFGFWKEYSGMAHAVFQGLLPTALFYLPDKIPHENREHFHTVIVDRMIGTHIFRTAAVLLCTLTEVQAHFQFEGANINNRLHEVWDALIPVPEIRELYDTRYAQLMKDKGITPDSKPTD
jgi:hypothetical protein